MRRSAILCGILVALVVSTCEVAWASYRGALSELFFGREPSARATALGRGYVATGDAGCAGFYNPAALACARGPWACFSRSKGYYTLKDAVYTFGYVTLPLGRYGALGFGEYHFDYGIDLEGLTPSLSEIAISYSSQLLRDLSAGLSLERVHQGLNEKESDAYMADLGFLLTCRSKGGSCCRQRVLLGGSLSNFTCSRISLGTDTEDLPVILRVGTAYSVSWSSESVCPSLTTLAVITHVEYLDLLNSDFHGGLRVGAEIQILDILALRAGRYGERLDDYGSELNRESVAQTTYGFGIQIPVERITGGVPVTARFDFVALDEPNLSTQSHPPNRYEIYTLSLGWSY